MIFEFTFHYELIITMFDDNKFLKGTRFTFHYELIITRLPLYQSISHFASPILSIFLKLPK